MTTQVQCSPSIRESLLSSVQWRCIGPHRGGRCVAVSGDVSDRRRYYFGACAGGVWKTLDGGTTWRNVSDGFFTTAAVGAIAVSTADPNVIYVGTGETCIRNNVSHGDGVYKSTDGGRTWRNMGLRDTRHVGKIRIHPRNPDLLYVAALGHAFGPNRERGIYRSRDGGESWEQVLFKSERAGCHDLAMDPQNPRVLYAPVWQTQRFPHSFSSGGPDSGLWRSTDGGDTWTEITRKPGLPKGVLGKIGVAVSPPRPGATDAPGRLWALVEAEDGALFRSDDGGETWERVCDGSFLRTRAWYYMHVIADPQDPDTVWGLNYNIWKSIDGGHTFNRIPSEHGDEHDLWINPEHPEIMIKGDDGGACVTYNGGASWSSIYNQPTAQMYHVITDNRFPYRVYGSQQDNSAISLPSMSVHGAITEAEWYAPGGGESGYIAVKPDDPDIVVASGPAGRHVPNDITTCYNHRTGQARHVTIWPELYGWGVGAESLKYRLGWTFPIMYSRHDPNVLYVAGNHLFRSTDNGGHFEVISPDLTRNDPEKLGPSGGPITRDNTGAEVYCQIFALAESPLRAGLLWAGSDDGLVHISHDGGRTWENITPPDLREPSGSWALISIIEASPHDEATAYLAATRYKLDDTRPYLYKTNDYGRTWTPITEGIPADDFTRVIREDPSRRGLLYAGTETGLYVSFDDGGRWQRLTGNLPVVPIHDLVIHGVEMVVATHGRSFWILDDLTPFHQVAGEVSGFRFQVSRAPGDAGCTDDAEGEGLDSRGVGRGGGAFLFAPRPTYRVRTEQATGREGVAGSVNYGHAGTTLIRWTPERADNGADEPRLLDAGANPPAGVVVHYFLAEKPKGDVVLRIRDGAGTELRAFLGEDGVPADVGMNRFIWNLRLPGATAIAGDELQAWKRDDGPMVLPGGYEVELDVGDRPLTQRFPLLPDPRVTTSEEDLRAQLELLLQIRDAISRANTLVNGIESTRRQLALWRERAAENDGAQAALEAVGALDGELRALETELIDVHMKGAQLYPSGLHEKLNGLFDTVDSADAAPTGGSVDVFVQLSAQLDDVAARIQRLMAERGTRLRDVLTTAGLAFLSIPAP